MFWPKNLQESSSASKRGQKSERPTEMAIENVPSHAVLSKYGRKPVISVENPCEPWLLPKASAGALWCDQLAR